MTGSHSVSKPHKAAPARADVRRAGIGNDTSDADVPGNDVPDPVDRYGNEVTDAVAKYRFDASGSLYELHSPQTEVPKLRPPKT